MKYGVNARIGNIVVFTREGAIAAYKQFCKYFSEHISMEASVVCSNAMLDMLALGFTPDECEAIELSVYSGH